MMNVDMALPSENKRRKPFAFLDGTGHRQRMRSRVISKGVESLEDYEILEMLLYSVIPRKDTKPLAKNLINVFGSFYAVMNANVKELIAYIPVKDFISLVIFIRLIAIRLTCSDSTKKVYLYRQKDIITYLTYNQIDKKYIQKNMLRILFLNGKQCLIVDEVVSMQDKQLASIIFRKAIESDAINLIFISYIDGVIDIKRRQYENSFVAMLQNNASFFALTISEYFIYNNDQYISIIR